MQEWGGGPEPYVMVNTGIMPGVPVCWAMYVAVEDLDASCAKLKELDGQIMKERTDVPEIGWFAIVADPQGATFGLW